MRFLYSTELTSDFLHLCKELEKELKVVTYDLADTLYNSIITKPSYDTIITIYDRDIPIGCGFLASFDEQTGEINGLYMEPSYRRKGYIKMLLLQLETIAESIGYNRLIIETHPNFINAILLYTSLGYSHLENYSRNTSCHIIYLEKFL